MVLGCFVIATAAYLETSATDKGRRAEAKLVSLIFFLIGLAVIGGLVFALTRFTY
jgi:hypothetical protein